MAAGLTGLVGPAPLAAEVYGGLGLTGPAIGVAFAPTGVVGLRVEASGGLSASRDGREEGVDYEGRYRAARGGVYADWFPFGNRFRFSGGMTYNQIKFTLHGRGGSATINGIDVDLTGETFDVTLRYPRWAPYLGLGWGHQPRETAGWDFFVDLGMSFGRFSAEAETTLVGKQGVTQEDVDAEKRKLRDSVAKVRLLPYAAGGATYRF